MVEPGLKQWQGSTVHSATCKALTGWVMCVHASPKQRGLCPLLHHKIDAPNLWLRHKQYKIVPFCAAHFWLLYGRKAHTTESYVLSSCPRQALLELQGPKLA